MSARFTPIAPPAHEPDTRQAPNIVGLMNAFDAALDRMTCRGSTMDSFPEHVHTRMTDEDAGEAFLMAFQKLLDAQSDGSLTPAQSLLFSLLEPVYVDACQLCVMRLRKEAEACRG